MMFKTESLFLVCLIAACLQTGCKLGHMCVAVDGDGPVVADTGFSSDNADCAYVQIGTTVSFMAKNSGYEISSCSSNDKPCEKTGMPPIHVVSIARGENDVLIATRPTQSPDGDACTYRGQRYAICTDICPDPPPDNRSLSFMYRRAVQDAAVVEASEISSTLEPLTISNDNLVWNADKTKVKVVTWKSHSSYTNYIAPYTQTSSSESNVVWVTMAPKLQNFCRQYMNSLSGQPDTTTKLNLRLKQRLGLSPDWTYDIFVEFWVAPADLFRPCVDPDTSDSICELGFGSTVPAVKNIADYKVFFMNLYYNDFRAAPGTPWTGLGYTYDWGNPASEQGESEFILSPSSAYEIERAVPTMEYCQP